MKKGTRKWRQEEKKKARLQAWHEKKGLRTQKQGHPHGLHGLHQEGGGVGAHGGGLAAVGRAGLASLQHQKQQLEQEEEEEEREAEGGVEGVRVGTMQGAMGSGGGDKGFRGVGRVPGMGGARRFGFKKAVRYARKAIRRVHGGKKSQGKGKLVHLV